MQGSARKDVVFGAARVYTATVPGPKWKSWLTTTSGQIIRCLMIRVTTLLLYIPTTPSLLTPRHLRKNPDRIVPLESFFAYKLVDCPGDEFTMD